MRCVLGAGRNIKLVVAGCLGWSAAPRRDTLHEKSQMSHGDSATWMGICEMAGTTLRVPDPGFKLQKQLSLVGCDSVALQEGFKPGLCPRQHKISCPAYIKRHQHKIPFLDQLFLGYPQLVWELKILWEDKGEKSMKRIVL